MMTMSNEDAPVEVSNGGVLTMKCDLATVLDVVCPKRWAESKNIVSDDTDIFVLLVHYCHTVNLKYHYGLWSQLAKIGLSLT